MLAALIAGERDPKVLAELARGRMRAKRSVLEEAFTGVFRLFSCFRGCLSRSYVTARRSLSTVPAV
jgi:hypothetical protein